MIKLASRFIATLVLLVSFTLPGFSGGEIPWPLYLQAKIQPSKVEGLWLLPGDAGVMPYYLNVEVSEKDEKGYKVRISQLSFPDQKPIRQGEILIFIGESNRFEAHIGGIGTSTEAQADHGSYIFMRGFSDQSSDIYFRMVSLEYDVSGIMGVSELPNGLRETTDHRFAYRISDSLSCSVGTVASYGGKAMSLPFQCESVFVETTVAPVPLKKDLN